MALTEINSEDRLVEQTFANHLHDVLSWARVYAVYAEAFAPNISKKYRERLKQGSKALLASVTEMLEPMKDHFIWQRSA